MVEPEVVATSPYRIKSPAPVCCGLDSVKLTRDKLTRNTKMAKHDCVSDPKCLSAHFMFERFERELLPKEKRLLVQKLSGWRIKQNRRWRNGFLFWLLFSSALSLLVLLSGERPWYVVVGLIFP